MARMMRAVLIAAASVVLFVVNVVAQVRPEQVDRGGEWLSWSQGERSTYIDGFITGYLRGSHKACDVTQELFGKGKVYRLADEHHPSEMPAARCLAGVDNYSKHNMSSPTDGSPYANVITEFYTKHPQYQGVPFAYLMGFLTDTKYVTADQLYQMALKGDLRTNF